MYPRQTFVHSVLIQLPVDHVAQQVKEYLYGKLDHLPSVPNDSSNKRKHGAVETAEDRPSTAAEPRYRRSDLERSLRSRENLLIVAGKDFSNVLKIYNSAERAAREEMEKLSRGQVRRLLWTIGCLDAGC